MMEVAETGTDLENELQNLKCRLKQTQDKATVWLNDEISLLLSSQTRRHEETLQDLQDQKERSEALLASKQENVLMSNKELEEKCSQLENLKKELERLCAVTQELHSVRAREEKEINTLKQDIEQLKTDIAAPTKAKQKLEYLNKAGQIFSNMLGLSFRKTKGNRIQVIFTQVDEKDPLMAFYFFLNIQGAGRRYVVSDPHPPIEGLEDLVTKLNETNNLRQFMITVRSQIKDSLNKR